MPKSKHRKQHYQKKKSNAQRPAAADPVAAPGQEHIRYSQHQPDPVEQQHAGWRRWDRVYTGEGVAVYSSKEEAQEDVFQVIREAGLIPEVVRDEWITEHAEELGEWGVLEIVMKCPHGVEGDSITLETNSQRDPNTWEVSEYSESWTACPVCQIW
jgi:hypothetical protein